MVYLVRTARYLRWDDTLEESTTKLLAHLRKTYPQIKDLRLLWNVAGPIDEFHWVMQFDSLAEEDSWAAKVIQDEVYLNWFRQTEGSLSPPVDRLLRDAPA